jgi:hypothetical protein
MEEAMAPADLISQRTPASFTYPKSEVISSGLTFIYKYVFTAFWLMPVPVLLLALLSQPYSNDDSSMETLPILVLFSLASVFVYWCCGRLKRVELTESSVIVSNYRRSVEVPFYDIESVSGSLLLNPELVWIRFKRPTEFGEKIVFMGCMRIFGGFSVHPIVWRLQDAIQQPQGAAWERAKR